MCNSRTIKPWKLCFSEFNNTIQFYLTLGLFWIIFFFFFCMQASWPFQNGSRRSDFISQRIALIRCLNSKVQHKVRVILTILEKITADSINFVEASHLEQQQCLSLKRSNSYVLFRDKNIKIFGGVGMTLSQM